MTVFNWLTLFGVPAIILAILTFIYKRLSVRIKQNSLESAAIKAGIQALLRDRLYETYSNCKKAGGATQSQRQNWDRLYTQYHNLGGNGVMNDTRSKFLALPIIDD